MHNVIANAVIEKGRIKFSDKVIPQTRMDVKIIFHSGKRQTNESVRRLVEATKGIYPEIDARKEAKNLRKEWGRKID